MKVPAEAPPVASPSAPAVFTPPIAPRSQVPPLLSSEQDKQPVPSPLYICSVCHQPFPIDKVYDLHGANICEPCYAATVAGPQFMAPPQPQTPDSTLSAFDNPAPAYGGDAPVEHFAAAAVENYLPSDDANYSETSEHDTAGFGDTVADIGPLPVSHSRTKRRRGNPLPTIIGWGAALLVAAFLTYYITRYGGSPKQDASLLSQPQTRPASVEDQAMSEWEKRNDPKLSQWRSTAKGMEITGDLAGAQLLYQKMLTLAKSPGATLQNPSTIGMLAEAQASFDAISKKIGYPSPPVAMAPQAGTPNHAPAAPSTAPAATAPPAPEPSAPASVAEAKPVDWEPAHKDQLLQLSADAGLLEKNHEPVAALAKLQQLLQTVADHRATLTDPQLKAAVVAAEVSRKRLALANRDSDELRALTARSLLAAGLKAEEEKKWKMAQETLSDSSRLLYPLLKPVQRYRDPAYLTALDAMAVADINLKQYQQAGLLFGDGEPLGRASLAINSPARDLIWNRAVNDMTQKFNIMRSVKMLHDYMDAHTDPDEPLLNLLGTILFIADETNPPDRRMLDDAIGFYSQRSMDLEKTHPGQRRWGIQWLSEDDAKAQFDAYNKALDNYQEAVRTKTAADTHLQDLQNAGRNGLRPSQKDINAAKEKLTAATAAIKAAHDAIPRPPWLTNVQPVVPTIDPAALALAVAPAAAPTVPPSATTPAPSTPVSPAAAQTPADGTSPSAVAIAPPPAPEARYTAAFPVDRTHLVTASEPLGTATHVIIADSGGGQMPAKVVATSGRLALLEVSPADAGGPLKYLPLATDFTGGPVQCAAIPQANLFGPTVTLLAADAPVPSHSAWWVSLSDHPRLAGSPLLDAQNQVIGVEVATRDDARQRIPAVTLDDLRKFLQSNGIVPAVSSTTPDPSVVSQVEIQSE
jgi:hypothetical protein